MDHYPIEYTRTDGKKGLYCNCGGPLPCPHFIPGDIKPAKTLPDHKQLTCLRCGHQWKPRVLGRRPAACPNCKQTRWDKSSKWAKKQQ